MATYIYEDLRRAAAEKQKLLTQDTKEGDHGLRSILAVEVQRTEDNEKISEEKKIQ